MRCIEYQQGTANQCFMNLLGSFIIKEKVSYRSYNHLGGNRRKSVQDSYIKIKKIFLTWYFKSVLQMGRKDKGNAQQDSQSTAGNFSQQPA